MAKITASFNPLEITASREVVYRAFSNLSRIAQKEQKKDTTAWICNGICRAEVAISWAPAVPELVLLNGIPFGNPGWEAERDANNAQHANRAIFLVVFSIVCSTKKSGCLQLPIEFMVLQMSQLLSYHKTFSLTRSVKEFAANSACYYSYHYYFVKLFNDAYDAITCRVEYMIFNLLSMCN